MSDADVRMVMRSVYLPEDMDEELRGAAFKQRISKSELIRRFVGAGLVQFSRHLDAERARREGLANRSFPDRNAARPRVEADRGASATAASTARESTGVAIPDEHEHEANPGPRLMSGF